MPIKTTERKPQARDMSHAWAGRSRKARERRFAGYVAEMRAAGLAVTVIESAPHEGPDGQRELFRP